MSNDAFARNSRADVDATIADGTRGDEETDAGTTRQKRVEEWRRRNHAVQGTGPAGSPPGILGPK